MDRGDPEAVCPSGLGMPVAGMERWCIEVLWASLIHKAIKWKNSISHARHEKLVDYHGTQGWVKKPQALELQIRSVLIGKLETFRVNYSAVS